MKSSRSLASLVLIITSVTLTIGSAAAASTSQPTERTMKALAHRIAWGDASAITELQTTADQLYRGIDYARDKERLELNRTLMRAAYDELGNEAAKGNRRAFDTIKKTLNYGQCRSCSSSAAITLGNMAADGNKEALDTLLHYDQWGLLKASAVMALVPAGRKGIPEAVTFLRAEADNPHSALRAMARDGLPPAGVVIKQPVIAESAVPKPAAQTPVPPPVVPASGTTQPYATEPVASKPAVPPSATPLVVAAAQTPMPPVAAAPPPPVAAAVTPVAGQDDVRAVLGDVEDRRTTGEFFGGLEIKIKLVGDAVADATSWRTRVTQAKDDTGRDLVDAKRTEKDFTEIFKHGPSAVTLKLKNPSRKAQSIAVLAGEVELLVPRNDPGANVKIDNIVQRTGAPLDAPVLKAVGVEVTIFTKEQADAEMARKRKEAEQKKAQLAGQAGSGAQLAKVFAGMFGFANVGPNDIALRIKDPESKLAKIEFQDNQGAAIHSNSRWTVGESSENKTTTYSFSSKLPPDARLVLTVCTPKSVIKVPFSLTNVALP